MESSGHLAITPFSDLGHFVILPLNTADISGCHQIYR
jgi:hypothetical protein